MHPERSVCFIMNDTKEYIIDEAFKLFLNHSYEAVSISDISKAIGFTKGALYHHFKNKEELFLAVVDKHLIFPEIDVDFKTITLKKFNELSIQNIKKILTNLCGDKQELDPINYLSLIADSFRHCSGFENSISKFLQTEIEKTKKVYKIAIQNGEIRSDIDISTIVAIHFSNSIGLAGNILRNFSIDKAITMLRNQLNEMYKLLKI